jgi:hypothetical protein
MDDDIEAKTQSERDAARALPQLWRAQPAGSGGWNPPYADESVR